MGTLRLAAFQGYKFSAFLLSNDFVRILVFPDSEKDWLTEAIIPGPLREFHLANHLRLHPMTTFHVGEGNPGSPQSERTRTISECPG